MDDLVAFLRARLNEDEYLAGKFRRDAEWDADTLARLWWYGPGNDPQSRSATDPIIQHAARYDPARVLREVEAKRAIVSMCEDWVAAAVELPVHKILRELAAVYRDHPAYRQEWVP